LGRPKTGHPALAFDGIFRITAATSDALPEVGAMRAGPQCQSDNRLVEGVLTSILLDMHAHLVPIDDAALAMFSGMMWDADEGHLVVDGSPLAMKSLYQPDTLLAWLDKNGIGEAWISIPPMIYRSHLGEQEAEAWCRYVNDGIVGLAAKDPRLTPMLYLPVAHPQLAARIAREQGAKNYRRWTMAAGAGPKVMLSDPAYHELWRALDEHAAFLFIHPGDGFDPRLGPFYLHNLLGNPMETAIAAAHLVYAGVLQKFPRLTVCLAHGGGATTALAGRWQRGRDTSRPGLDLSVEPPREAVRRLFVDCVVHDDATLRLAAEIYGPDKIVFGSDWPFPMGLPDPQAQLAGLEGALRQRISIDNPRGLVARLA
jgi:aminocarboxymuconate-semialdehyde decarboxylase